MDIITNGETSAIFFEDDHYDERDDWESEEYYESDPPDEDDYNSNDFKQYCILELDKSTLYACKRAIAALKHSLIEEGINAPKIIDKWCAYRASHLYAARIVDNKLFTPNPTNFNQILDRLKMEIRDEARAKKRIKPKS